MDLKSCKNSDTPGWTEEEQLGSQVAKPRGKQIGACQREVRKASPSLESKKTKGQYEYCLALFKNST